jgi:hypothetical protein
MQIEIYHYHTLFYSPYIPLYFRTYVNLSRKNRVTYIYMPAQKIAYIVTFLVHKNANFLDLNIIFILNIIIKCF